MNNSLVRYWDDGRLYQQLNQPWHHLLLPPNTPATSPAESIISQDALIWTAPFVFEKKSENHSEFIIPLWLSSTGLPFIPAYLFDPLGQYPLFTEPLHVFDQWLRFERSEENAQPYLTLLDQLSQGTWQHTLQSWGFEQTDRQLSLPEAVLRVKTSPAALNQLQQQFAQYFTEDDELPEPETASFTVHPFTRGDPAQAVFVEELQQSLLNENKTAVVLQNDSFIPLDRMKACDVLIIQDAERLLPQMVFPYLAFAQKAVFIGDPLAMTPSPIMTGYQESQLLAQAGLSDDGVQEELYYRGMGIANGSALKVAMTHPLYGHHMQTSSQQPDFACKIAFMDMPGASEDGMGNRAQALALAQGLSEKSNIKDMHPQDVTIVTLFKKQQAYLQTALNAVGIKIPVVTLHQLPSKRVKQVIFSTVYTKQDPRPFLLDVGEALWHQLQAAATECLWIVGDKTIFDAKCHSPTGKIAKQSLLAI